LTYEIEIAGRIRRVSVRREGGGFAVAVDGRSFHVDAARTDPHSLSLIVDDGPVPGTSLDVAVADGASNGRLTVQVGALPIPVTMNGRRGWRSRQAASTAAGPQRIATPMPGKIVRVLVKVGDVVAPRQPVVVVEAMKMENELRAARGGTVAEVHGREGASVDAGALLVVIQ